MSNIVKFLCFVLTLNVGHSQLDVGDTCTVQATGAQGTCVLLLDCAKAFNEFQTQNKFPQRCGFKGTQVIVCCEAEEQPTTVPTAQRTKKPTTTRTTTRTTTKPTEKPNIVDISMKGPRIPGEISYKKCREYSKLSISKGKPPILSLYVEEQEQDECGFKVVPLIVGGEKANRQEFPHMAAIGFETTDNKILWQCGGSIISEQYVLTAGHCLISRDLGESKMVKLGVTNLNDRRQLQEIRIAERLKYPEYNPASHYHDIGLLKLEKAIDLNTYARPACLFTKKQISSSRAVASGWGRVEFYGDGSDDLLKVTLDFFSDTACNRSYRNQIGRKLKRGILDDIQICAGSLNEEKDTCQGDSGGPLQIYHKKTDGIVCMYDIVGVTSFGKACGIGNSPGIYTRVSNYIKWIEDIVWP